MLLYLHGDDAQGLRVGLAVGAHVCPAVVGARVGDTVGTVGVAVVGATVGATVGAVVGAAVGGAVGALGLAVGANVAHALHVLRQFAAKPAYLQFDLRGTQYPAPCVSSHASLQAVGSSAPHVRPWYPEAHVQPNVFTPSLHVPPCAHGYDAHSSMFVLHVDPAKPFAHVQEYAVLHAAVVHLPSWHVPPFMHGDDMHSTMFVQFLPPSLVSYPLLHTHSCTPTPTCMHSARTLSQSFSTPEQRSTSMLHTAPAHVAAHVHVNLPPPSEHVAPFMHGDDAHSSTSTSQRKPLYPAAHAHVNEATRSAHVPACWHGLDAHSSSSVAHEPAGTSV